MQVIWKRRSNHNTAGGRWQAVGKIIGHCGLQLVSAIDTQNEQFLADSCDKLLVRVADEIVPVGDPALEGLKLDWAGPKQEGADAVRDRPRRQGADAPRSPGPRWARVS